MNLSISRQERTSDQTELPICTACGSQYDLPTHTTPPRCKICNDPRQFVPPTGQSWTNQRQLQQQYKNVWQQDPHDPNLWSVWTEPKFGIGQRAMLLRTEGGNVLWDLITLLDAATIEFIRSKGGLDAIVISHPHYYTTYVDWARAFGCRVYVSADDKEWLCQTPPSPETIEIIEGPVGAAVRVLPGVTAIKTGGHFDGSLVLHWEKRLFIADSIVTVPSAYTPHPRPPGQTSYSFQWSIPNMIPLPPDVILKMWRAVEPFAFDSTYGAFLGMDVRDGRLKGRMLESMQIQVRGEGWGEHEILREVLGEV